MQNKYKAASRIRYLSNSDVLVSGFTKEKPNDS